MELGTDRGTATIIDDDDIRASVTGLETVVLEGSDATFEVALTRTEDGGSGSGSGSREVVVNYRVTDGSVSTAEAGKDYTAPSGKLNIPAGRSTGTIVIPTRSDRVLELAGETLAVMLTGADSAAGMVEFSSQASNPVTTIRDADGAVVVSVADAAPVDEGDPAIFKVTLSGKVSHAVSVTATTPNSPERVGSIEPATLMIDAGDTTGTITVQTTGNELAENTDTFTLQLGQPTTDAPSVVLGKATATGRIRDDDPLRVNLVEESAVLAAAQRVVYTLQLDGGKGSQAITVDYTYTVTGTVGSFSGTDTATIGLEQSSGTLAIENSMVPDNSVDLFTLGPRLTVTLTDVSTDAGTVTLGRSTARTALAATRFLVQPASGPEDGNLIFTVTREGDATNVDVEYETVPGTARANSDYTPREGTLAQRYRLCHGPGGTGQFKRR